MPSPTIAGQSEIRFIKETSEGGGVPTSGTLRYLSDSVSRVGLRVRGNRQFLYDIGEVSKAVDTFSGVKEFELEVRFAWQDSADAWTALQDWINRGSDGRLAPYAFEVGKAIDASAKAYYTLKGAKPQTAELSVDEDGLLMWTITFMVLDVATSTTQPVLGGTTTRQTSAIGSAYFSFIGGKVESPAGTALAYATANVTVTVNQNLSPLKDIGSTTVKTYVEGRREFSVRARITADDGGKALFDAVAAGTEANVVFQSSTTSGKPKITLTNTNLPEMEVASDDTGEFVSADIDRPAESITLGTV